MCDISAVFLMYCEHIYKLITWLKDNKPEFDEIFNLARKLYAEIINNPTSQQSGNVMTPEQVYPP
jgi:hypothetical protein